VNIRRATLEASLISPALIYRALLTVCRALLSVFTAFVSVYRALLSIYRAILSECTTSDPQSIAAITSVYIQGSFESIPGSYEYI